MRCCVFPGQGTQKRGMGAEMLARFPQMARRADDVLGFGVEQLCLEDPEGRLGRTEYAQPAIYVVGALHFLGSGLPAPDYLAGHSLGEYTALFAAGAVDFETGLELVRHRGELMGAADDGGMAAVAGAGRDVVEDAIRAHGGAGVVVANHNAPDQVVLSGPTAGLDALTPALELLPGVRVARLRVAGAFHSPLMDTAAREFRSALDAAAIAAPRIPVVSGVTGRPIGDGAQDVRDTLAAQMSSPVRWVDAVRFLRGAGVTEFVELGGGTVLTGLIEKITAADAAPWRDHRDERVLALLRDCADGRRGVDDVLDTLRAGGVRTTEARP